MKTQHTLRAMLATAALAALTVLPASGFTLEGTFAGTTRYVSKSGSDSNGGTSWDDAKLTIQAAVNLCADGDTVVVDDGEYSDTTPWTATVSKTTYNNPCVVNITKRIHLVSRNGKYRTHIVGQWASSSTGVANDGTAHRCIYIDGPNNAVGTLIEGFTIRNGATAGSGSGNNAVDSGGGICGGASSAVTDKKWYVLDCDFVNCRAGLGAAISRGCIPIRCAFVGNCAVNSTATQHVFYRTSYAYNCIFANNGPASRSNGAIMTLVQPVTVVNCTFIDNTCYGFKPNTDQKALAYNCAFLGSGEQATASAGNSYVFTTNCVQTGSSGQMATIGLAGGNTVGVSEYQHYFAADTGKWTFVEDGDLKDAGTDDALTVAATFVPEEYLDTDFFGNPRNWTSVDIGAIEAQGDAADPALGYIECYTNVAVSVEGKIMALPPSFKVSCVSNTAQARIVATLNPSDALFGYALSGDWGSFYRYPDLVGDNGAWITPPGATSNVVVNARAASAETWVDGSYAGGDSDGSEAKPFTTIQDAVDHTAAYGLVHVAPGTYSAGGVTLAGHTVASRVGIETQVAIRAIGSAEDTIIEGGENTRCVAVRRQAVTAHLQGFTLESGTVDKGASDADGLGGGFYATPQSWTDSAGLAIDNQRNAQVTDCIFSGNSARQGSAMCGGWAQRCVFVDNAATANNRVTSTQTNYDYQRGAVAFKSVLSACLVRNNLQTRTDTVSSLYKCHPYNVTFSETNRIADSSSSYRPVDRNTPAYNCAFMGGYLDAHNDSVTIVPAGNVADTSLTSRPWLARYDKYELFADPDGGDLRLKTATDASTKGDATAYRAAMFAVGDFDGNALAYVDGNPVPGAYSTLVEGVDLYVDATSGNDANDGRSASAAKKTLAAALAIAHTGDTVHAAAGDYDEGSQTHSGTVLIAPTNGVHCASRGVVPAGVTLIADDGPDVTFITGATDDANGNGLGDNALRCLTALAGSTVSGFTLKDGATFHTTGGMRDENMGGLALAPSCRFGESRTAVFENCVFSNGYARTAADVAGGVLRRCRLQGGQTTSGATISMYSRFEHCLLVNTDDEDTGVRFCGGMRSCTYVNTQGKGSGDNSEFHGPLTDFTPSYENSILATANLTGGNAVTMKNMTNCLWVTGGGNATVDSATCANVTTVATVAEALAMLDEGYAPLAGSALVDAGDRALLAKLADGGETDLAGGQRIYGGQVDIGAFEYDLRPDIAKALNRRVSVSAAGEEVALDGGTVRIPDGAVEATITDAQAGSFLLPVEVTGTGTLSIYLGASDTPWQTLAAVDGAQELHVSISAGTTPLRFAYAPGPADTGCATIGALASTNPFVLVVR